MRPWPRSRRSKMALRAPLDQTRGAGAARGACRLTLFEIVRVDAFDAECLAGRDADVVLDHQLGQARAVAENEGLGQGHGME